MLHAPILAPLALYLVAPLSGVVAPLPGARPGPGGPIRSVQASQGLRFEALPAERTGIALVNDFAWGGPQEHLYPHGFAGGGVAVGDYDSDGLPDLYLTCQTGPDRLYRNRGGLRFEDVTAAAGIDNPGWSSGVVFADVDGDGDLDLFVCNYDAPNRMYVNRGDGSFADEAAARGLDFAGASLMGAFADHDRDGDLDLYLVTNRRWPGAALDVPRTRQVGGQVEVDPAQAEAFALQERTIGGEVQKFVVKAGQRDRLYVNDGSGVFSDGSAAAGIEGNHPGLSVVWWDVDDDGWPDLYVSNDFWDADRLYHNLGDGTFVDRVHEWCPNTPWFSMGADTGDLDGDGRVDLLAADMSATTHFMAKVMMGSMGESRWFLESAEPRQAMRNTLLLATGVGPLREAAFLAHLQSSDWTWAVQLGDLDNDGHLDAFFTNGTANHSFDPDYTARLEALSAEQSRRGVTDPEERAAEQWQLYRAQGVRRERNLAFAGRGELVFEDVSRAFGLDHEGVSFGAALADLDRDGDLDLVVQNVGDPVGLYENRSKDGRSLQVELRGRDGNTRALGARLIARTAAGRRAHQLFTTRGYMSSTEAVAHFGLGSEERADLEVRWPDGTLQSLEGLAAGELHLLRQPEPDEQDGPDAAGSDPAAEVLFERVVHPALTGRLREEPHDDYAAQPLLPGGLSREGPCLALGDVDGDGDDDLYVGGPAGRPGRLHRLEDGEYGPYGLEFAGEAASEDTAALFLDVDADGDLDLLVASGSIEVPPGDPLLADRLYVNDGLGGLVLDRQRLDGGTDSTGALAAADLDGDGDLEVFAGARSIPGRYPETPRSRLLWNQGGRLVEATAERAPGLERVGLVTGALFSDVDLDGRVDLLVSCEWGPVALFLNRGGRLEDHTAAAGLAERTGWWNGITAGDVDGDGDQDYLVANVGLNTKYKASPGKPARLYYGDFDGTGRPHLVEAKGGDPELLPVRGLSCSSDAMPVIRERLGTYAEFAAATLPEIYPDGVLDTALALQASELETGVLINLSADGRVAFRWEPLPRIAQIAPAQGALAADVDADGALDLVLAQNFFWREPETGRWNGGLGQVLAGDGRGGFEPIPPARSGWVVPGDARALVLSAGAGRAVELLVARNDDAVLTHRLVGPGARGLEAWRLVGPPGNPTAAGARVVAGGRTIELAAGSGKASQSAPVVLLPAGTELVAVRWPDGARTEHARPAGDGPRVLERGRAAPAGRGRAPSEQDGG